jgi:hypothetical protein
MRPTIAILALLAATGLAHAQIAPPPAAEPAPAAAQPTQPLTLIKQDPVSGMILRLSTTPEEAALELIQLTPEEKAAVDKALAERAAILDKTLSSNIGTLLKSQGLRKDDNNQERMQALVELHKQAKVPLDEYNKQNGTLLVQLQKILAPEKFTTVSTLVSDYRNALFAQASATFRTSTEKDEAKRQAQIRGMETMMAFGFEVGRSYDRQIAAKESQLEAILKKVGATPEQEQKIGALTAQHRANAANATPLQRREFFKTVFIELDDRQKLVFLSELYGVKAPEPTPTPIPAPVAQPDAAKAPEPISDDAIAALDRNQAIREFATRAAFVQKNPQLDEATKERLKAEAKKCRAQAEASK